MLDQSCEEKIEMAMSEHPTPQQIRDIMIFCFVDSQKETMRAVAKRTRGQTDDATVEKKTMLLVKQTFERMKVSYDNPSGIDLDLVFDALIRKVKAMGTPSKLVQERVPKIKALIAKVK